VVILWRLRHLNPSKKILALLIIIIGTSFIIVHFEAWKLLENPIDLRITETAVVKKAAFDSTNNNILLLDVQSTFSKTIEFNAVVIKDSNQITVATIVEFSEDIAPDENSIIPVNLRGIKLSSGNYTANLWTAKSHVFQSPPFTIR
jgi:hypothetical protein